MPGLLVLLAILVVPGAAAAQAPRPIEALGVRFLRGEQLPEPFGLSLVAPTADGFVAVAVDDRLAGRLDLGREPHSTTEYYLPDDVLQWATGISRVVSWVNAPADTAKAPSFVLGAGDGLVLEVSGVMEDGRRQAKFRMNRCRESEHREAIDQTRLIVIAARFRRAALRAVTVGTRQPPDDAVWYRHALGCAAIPDRGNVAPPWPRGADLRPHQEIMQFVVGKDGRVEPGSERFLASSDARFAASIRNVLPSWRFTPARRMSRPVRQVAHLNVGFTPPIVLGPGESSDALFSAMALYDMISMLPQGDGLIRIANNSEVDGRHLAREPDHTAVTLPAVVYRQFIDTVARLLPVIDTTGPVANGPDYGPDSPMFGSEQSLGLNMWMSRTGWIRAGFWCGRMGHGQARFLEVRPSEFPLFRRAALDAIQRVPLQPAWLPRDGKPYLEHELTCQPVRIGHHAMPSLPRRHDQTSLEIIVSLTLDEVGNVDLAGVETMPGVDSALRVALLESMKRWTFHPAVAGRSHVRARTHINVILRPADADGVVLASLSRDLMPEDTLRRTVFREPSPGAPNVTPLIKPDMAQRVMPLLQPNIDNARQSWPNARGRFLTGLPLANELVVTTMTEDNLGHSAFVFVKVDRLVEGVIHGHVWQNLATPSDWRRGDLFAFPEKDLLDWRIVRPDGTIEGNFLGKFLGRQ